MKYAVTFALDLFMKDCPTGVYSLILIIATWIIKASVKVLFLEILAEIFLALSPHFLQKEKILSYWRNARDTRIVTPIAQKERNTFKDTDSRSYSAPPRSNKKEARSSQMRGAKIILCLLRARMQYALDVIRDCAYHQERKEMILSNLEVATVLIFLKASILQWN